MPSSIQQSVSSQPLSYEEFHMSEMVAIKEKLAELNQAKDLRGYFRRFRALIKELEDKQKGLEVDQIIYGETLQQMASVEADLKSSLLSLRKSIIEAGKNAQKAREHASTRVKRDYPVVAAKLEATSAARSKLARLRFAREFLQLRDQIRACLRSGQYVGKSGLVSKYTQLTEMHKQSQQLFAVAEPVAASPNPTRGAEYNVLLDSLNEFVITETRGALLDMLGRLKFPFEEAIDYKAMRSKLQKTADAFKAFHSVQALAGSGAGFPALQVLFDEFGKRFHYHFYRDKPTNNAAKPEWFFTQLSLWISNNLDYFEQFIQPCMYETERREVVSTKSLFLEYMVELASKKVRSMIAQEDFIKNRRLLSHLIDETVLFEREIQEVYDYSEANSPHVIAELCDERVLDGWIKLERDTISVGIDSILADSAAYEPRYKGAADIDAFLVPSFADSFVILMQSLFERYSTLPDTHIQCRFLKLQLVIVDEFRSRIVQIFHQIDTPWRTPYPQLMNALWYLTLVLDDWSDMPEYIRLQYYLDNPAKGGDEDGALVRGTFDENSGLYRYVWRQMAKQLSEIFVAQLHHKLTPYLNEPWQAHEAGNPIDVTPSFAPFLTELARLMQWINANISPDSVLTIHHLTLNEVWSLLLAELTEKGRLYFNYRGASQILFDITTALIPQLTSLYSRTSTRGGGVKASTDLDVVANNKCISLLNSLRLLALHPATAILLLDELNYIHEQQLDERLEPFSISGLGKRRVEELLRQRIDVKVE